MHMDIILVREVGHMYHNESMQGIQWKSGVARDAHLVQQSDRMHW